MIWNEPPNKEFIKELAFLQRLSIFESDTTIVVLSSNDKMLPVHEKHISLTNITKDPKSEPCGTPHFISE